MLVCEDSLCLRKQPDVSGPGLREAGRYNHSDDNFAFGRRNLYLYLFLKQETNPSCVLPPSVVSSVVRPFDFSGYHNPIAIASW